MITVHHLNRSRSLRIIWLLEELGTPYQVTRYERDAKTSLAPPELLKMHPLGKSPMIEMYGRLITESAAITESICLAHGAHMIPSVGSDAHFTHMELMHFAEGSAMTPILLNLYVSKLGEAGSPLHPRIRSELKNHFDYMEQVLRPSGHYVLDQLSAADIMLSFPAQIAMRTHTADDYPKLAAFVKMIQDRPAFGRALVAAGND